MENIFYPIRINRYLALKNYCSRRKADELIKQKQIFINGKIAELGDKVHGNDIVKLATDAKNLSKQYVYLAYNKPAGIETHASAKGQKDIKSVLKFKAPVFPLGRLDKNSEGLIILTNDGRITDKLLNPKHEREKEYVVQVNKPLSGNFIKRISSGMQLEDFRAKKCDAKQIDARSFQIILTEGKKRQIRRMCEALGYEVKNLKRTRIINIELGNLQSGQYREIKGEELKEFLAAILLK